MKRIMALLLIVVLAGLPALAEGVVRTTASVNLREGPGLDYDKILALKPHTVLDYLGETQTDARGVDWYLVDYQDMACWISSRYSVLEYEPGEDDADDEPVAAVSDTDAADYIEISHWYGHDLPDIAEAIGLDRYEYVENCEVPKQYYNKAMRACGWDVAECFEITGAGYKLYGVYIGMDAAAAKQKMTDAGLILFPDDNDLLTFEHLRDENSLFDTGNDKDYCVNVYIDPASNRVKEINLSTYSG